VRVWGGVRGESRKTCKLDEETERVLNREDTGDDEAELCDVF
jgi:hypothetical protein